MFSDLYKNDNQMIAPSDELILQIAEKMKAEAQTPTKLFRINTLPVSRLATIAAAVVIVIAAAVILPMTLNNDSLKTADSAAGAGLNDGEAGATNEARIALFEETSSPFAEKGVEKAEITEEEFEEDAADYDVDGGEILIEEYEYDIVDDGEFYGDYDEDDGDDSSGGSDLIEEAVAEDPFDIALTGSYYYDYASYTEWAAASIWNELPAGDITPPKTTVPDNFDVMDSTEIPGERTDLKTLGEFAAEYLSESHRILTLDCTAENGAYPSGYAVSNMAELYAPVYSLFNKYLDSKITYKQTNDVMPCFPFVYNNNYDDVIMFDMRTEKSIIYVYITSGDKLILQKNDSFAGEYELSLEDGAYKKLWNYINSSPDYILEIAEQE